MRTTKEIIDALRVEAPMVFNALYGDTMKEAADCLEQLQAENKMLKKKNSEAIKVYEAYFKAEAETLRNIYDKMIGLKSMNTTYEEAIKELHLIADEIQTDLEHNKRQHTAVRRLEALSVAIKVLAAASERKQEKRELARRNTGGQNNGIQT